jgi:hypothetical protein
MTDRELMGEALEFLEDDIDILEAEGYYTGYHQEIVDLSTNFHTALTKVIAKMRSVTALLEQRDKSTQRLD